MKVLALDFDGVISDSAPESYVVAVATYATHPPAAGAHQNGAAANPDGAIPTRASVEADPRYRRFLELMPLGNRAEDFAIALRSLEVGEALPDQAAYDAFRRTLDEARLRDFHERFYAYRRRLAERDHTGWLALMGPYPEVGAALHRRAGDAVLAIATAKDGPTVDALLESYGLAELFHPDRILDKETGVGKAAHLERLQSAEGVDFRDITFVDDKVNHLDGVAHLGVRCALAAWGYNGPREEALARERGYAVCTLADFEAQLFSG